MRLSIIIYMLTTEGISQQVRAALVLHRGSRYSLTIAQRRSMHSRRSSASVVMRAMESMCSLC